MSVNYEKKLHKKVIKFKKRADKDYPDWNERNDNGEWEIGLDEFDEMCDVIFEIIENIACTVASEQMLDDILFGIARDNECSRIVDRLIEYPEWYSLLCKKSLTTESAYSLMFEPHTAISVLRDTGRLTFPREDDSLRMWEYLTETLSSHGYRRSEISNYSRPGFESVHNSSYWKG